MQIDMEINYPFTLTTLAGVPTSPAIPSTDRVPGTMLMSIGYVPFTWPDDGDTYYRAACLLKFIKSGRCQVQLLETKERIYVTLGQFRVLNTLQLLTAEVMSQAVDIDRMQRALRLEVADV